MREAASGGYYETVGEFNFFWALGQLRADNERGGTLAEGYGKGFACSIC